MWQLLLIVLVICTINVSLGDEKRNRQKNRIPGQQVGQSMDVCFGETEIIECLKTKFSQTLDKAIASNETWQLSDFFEIERNEYAANENNIYEAQTPAATPTQQYPLPQKMLQLSRMRSLKLHLPISTLGSMMYELCNLSEGADADAEVQQLEQEEGRKKRYKDKNVAMMGGMAMLAMVAQMFLGKVILIAGAAFVMAKIALLISVLGSLKKGTTGNDAVTDHVIVGGHNYDHASDWHRRAPYDHNSLETVASDGHKFTEPVSYQELAQQNKYKRRHPYQMPANKI